MTIKENAKLVRQWLEGQKWRFREQTQPDGVVRFNFGLNSDCDVCRGYDITILCRDNDVQSLFHLPVRMSEKMSAPVLDYVNRVNYRFRLGKLTVDARDGEIRFEMVKTAWDLKGDLDDAMDDLVGFPGYVLDRFLPGLALVILGVRSAAEAYEECDRDPTPPADTDAEPPPSAPTAAVPPAGAVAPTVVEPAEAPRKPRRRTRTSASAPEAKPADSPADAQRYSLEGLNLTTPIPLPDVVEAVRRFRDGTRRADVDSPRLNILLSGAPGSGKTAFVKYLAREVGAALRVVKASDLLSRYSGDTEQRIAESFRAARERGEILFLDEIDSFLQDRSGADRPWEISQVNELLQQMEEFSGVMVGATNFADNLDKAVLRRFTYKLKLDYLTEEGKGIFFERYFRTPLTAAESRRLKAIGNLTPGDFRTVRESLYYLADKQDNASRLAALEAESAAKGATTGRIGF